MSIFMVVLKGNKKQNYILKMVCDDALTVLTIMSASEG